MSEQNRASEESPREVKVLPDNEFRVLLTLRSAHCLSAGSRRPSVRRGKLQARPCVSGHSISKRVARTSTGDEQEMNKSCRSEGARPAQLCLGSQEG